MRYPPNDFNLKQLENIVLYILDLYTSLISFWSSKSKDNTVNIIFKYLNVKEN